MATTSTGATPATRRYRWEDVEKLADVLAHEVCEASFTPDVTIAVLRGGAIPAVLLAHRLGVNARSAWDTIHPGRARAGPWPNRTRTLDEMLSQVERGIAISLMIDGPDRQTALDALRSEKSPVVWSHPLRADSDRRRHVGDEGRFLAEVRRMGLSIGSSDYRVADQEILAREEANADDGSSDEG